MRACNRGLYPGFEEVTLNKDFKSEEELAKWRSWLFWRWLEEWWCWRRALPAPGPGCLVTGTVKASLTGERKKSS